MGFFRRTGAHATLEWIICVIDPKGLLTVPAHPDYITDQSVTFWP